MVGSRVGRSWHFINCEGQRECKRVLSIFVCGLMARDVISRDTG